MITVFAAVFVVCHDPFEPGFQVGVFMIVDVVFKFMPKLVPFIMHICLLIDFYPAVNGPSEPIQRNISAHNALSIYCNTNDS